MKLDVTTGAMVMLDLSKIREQAERLKLVDQIGQWTADNVYGQVDTVFIRQGSHVSEQMVLNCETLGHTIEEQWLWIFSDPKEATLFKLTFG